MAATTSFDQAIVNLLSKDKSPDSPHPTRCIKLSKDMISVSIGRTSKRNSQFQASKHNGWIDSAVMSRDHAKLSFDLEKQAVFIRDIGSLHGTYVNEKRLDSNKPEQLKTGDTLQFGLTIERGADTFSSCIMTADIELCHEQPDCQPTVFRVPDDTDAEDLDSDDEVEIRNSSKILRNHNIRPAKGNDHTDAITIDLTSMPISGTDLHDIPLPSKKQDEQGMECVDLTVGADQEQELSGDSSRLSPFQNQDLSDENEFVDLSELEDDLLKALDEDHEAAIAQDSSISSILSSNSTPNNKSGFFDETAMSDLVAESPESGKDAEDVELKSIPSNTESFQAIESASKNVSTFIVDNSARISPEIITNKVINHKTIQSPSSVSGDASQHVSLKQIQRASSNNRGVEHTFDATCHPKDQGLKTLADVMGAATGKSEYFAAREQNKVHAHRLASDMYLTDVDWHSGANQNSDRAQNGTMDLLGKSRTSDVQPPKCSRPVPGLQSDAPTCSKPHCSIKLVPSPVSKRTHVGIQDIVNSPDEILDENDAVRNSTKRKAAEISTLTPQEIAAEAKQCSPTAREDSNIAKMANMASERVPQVTLDHQQPPAKRLRRIAEVIGYAALGGVAVMSALIATAPTL